MLTWYFPFPVVAVAGTLAYHISNGLNLRKSVIYAVECASISVTRKGAQTSYPERSELNYSHI